MLNFLTFVMVFGLGSLYLVGVIAFVNKLVDLFACFERFLLLKREAQKAPLTNKAIPVRNC